MTVDGTADEVASQHSLWQVDHDPHLSTAVNATRTQSPRLGTPEPATLNDPDTRRVWSMVPSRDADGRATMAPLYVTREATDLSAPTMECPVCEGIGELPAGIDRGGLEAVMCDVCSGSGRVTVPPSPPSSTGAVPADSPMARPVSEDDLVAQESLPDDPNIAAHLRAIQARTETMRQHP